MRASNPYRKQRPAQRLELNPPRQANLQFVNDTWERLLNALERLEQVTESFTNISADWLDDHPDRYMIQEDETSIRSEVHLQIKCLQRVIAPVVDDAEWLADDFLVWFAGRAGRPWAPVDEYAAPILRCIRSVPYELPALLGLAETTRGDILAAVEQLGAGLHHSDQIEGRFVRDPSRQAEMYRHHRGSLAQGLLRVSLVADPWVASFVASREQSTSPGESDAGDHYIQTDSERAPRTLGEEVEPSPSEEGLTTRES